MPVQRTSIVGHPHTYYINARCALDQPLFNASGEAEHFLHELEQVRGAFDGRVFALVVTANAVHLLVQHHASFTEGDEFLRQRWALIGGNSSLPRERLQARLTSLSGFMQVLLQRYSRDWNRRHRLRGSIWASRYRACLLADDAAVLAAIAWIEEDLGIGEHAIASSRGRHSGLPAQVLLAPPPLRVGPGGLLFPADDAPPGLSPPPENEVQDWLSRFSTALRPEIRAAYGAALRHGWALGRPESLTDVLARLGRKPGRGRSRNLRDLEDDLGLCGVWG